MQPDHDEEMGLMHGMDGTLDAELEVQRTMKRAEKPAFLRLLRKAIGRTVVHVDIKGIIDGLWRRRGEVQLPKKRTTQTCGSWFGKDCTEVIKKAYWWKRVRPSASL